MDSITSKRAFVFLSILVLVSAGCDLTVTVSPSASPASPTSIPVTSAPVATATILSPSLAGVEVTVDPLRVILSPGLATGVRGIQIPRAEGDEIAWWEITPGHVELNLEGYILQNSLHRAQVYVYPAQDYAELLPAAFESIHRLNNILYDPATEDLPLVPFFNAAQVFASNRQVITFQSGRGVRFLTESAQYAAPVNNRELFYQFQGLTSDGAYYIVAILPISARVLPETSDPAAVLPPGGIPYPDIANSNAELEGYYTAVTALLDATSPEAFTPTLGQLDALVQSMRVNP